MASQTLPAGLRVWYFNPITQVYTLEKKSNSSIRMEVEPVGNISCDKYGRAIRWMGNHTALAAIVQSSVLSDEERLACLQLQGKLSLSEIKGINIKADYLPIRDWELVKNIWKAVFDQHGLLIA